MTRPANEVALERAAMSTVHLTNDTVIPPGIPLANFYQERGGLQGRLIGGAQANILISETSHFAITSHVVVQSAIQEMILRATRPAPLGGRS